MRRSLLFLLLSFSVVACEKIEKIAEVDVISFKDPNFKAYCVSQFDTDGDGEISYVEASSVEEIECVKCNITSVGQLPIS